MRREATSWRPRPGFTLIELLVVIGIILVLMAILLPVVMAVWAKMDDVRQIAEIKALQDKMAIFLEKYGRYPPAQVVLIENGHYDLSNPEEAYSWEYLRGLFNGIYLSTDANAPHSHDWDGDNQARPGLKYHLEGDQCLVYFLSGPQQRGFLRKRDNPVEPGKINDPDRDVFYEFDQKRLVPASDYNASGDPTIQTRRANSASFKVYKDRNGTPYAYFLARDTASNNYFNDCPSLCGPAFHPYFDSAVSVQTANGWTVRKYHNPNTYQIISAGRPLSLVTTIPEQFGTGGPFNRNAPNLLSPADQNNYANFLGGQLRYGH